MIPQAASSTATPVAEAIDNSAGEGEGEDEDEDSEPPLSSSEISLSNINQVVDQYNSYSKSFLSELVKWNKACESSHLEKLSAKQKEYDELKSKYDAIQKKFDTMKSLFA